MTVRVVLMGRPNAGKSSVYNALTGGNAKVGNFPGITVDIMEADVDLPSGVKARVADLPGLYSIEANVDSATDEGVAKKFLEGLRGKDDAHVVVQIADPTRLGLALRLTRELVKAKTPLVLALTHKDILANEGHAVDIEALSDAIGVPVVMVDTRDKGARATILAAVDERLRAGDIVEASGTFEPARVAKKAIRDVGDEGAKKRRARTEHLDRLLLHPILGPFLFVGLMAAVFAMVFLVADPASAAIDWINGRARGLITGAIGEGIVTSFIVDGMLGGAGTVLAFMPQIVILTIALELLEASGYLARGAFLVDRLLRSLGLSGRSFVPLLMGHACAVPAIAATRIVRDPRERLTTILVLPLMTCSARLPTYGLVLATFFSHKSVFFRSGVFVGLYFSGMFAALLASWVLRRTATKGKGLPLVLEMPAYRMPQPRVVARKAWQAAKRFVHDVGTVILCVAMVLWVLLTVPLPGSKGATPIERSIASSVGRSIEPITRPAGFDWRINVGLIGSFGARELMVGTMGVINGIENASDQPAPLAERLRTAKTDDGRPLYSTATGLALLAFFVLACQCMSTLAAIRRETKSWRWPALVLAYTYALGYAAAVIVYQLSRALGAS